jgi:hypothetical protein
MLFIILSLAIVKAQKTHKNDFIIAGRLHKGFIIAHAEDLKDISKTSPYGIEFDFYWQLMGEKTWNYTYTFQKVGFSLFYNSFSNPDVLGSSIATTAFIEPALGIDKKISGLIRFGIGPNYLTQVYDSISNPANTFFSSRISFMVLLKMGLNYRINDRLSLETYANYNHCSNGGIKKPNRGINFPTFSVGMNYKLRRIPTPQYVKTDTLRINPRKQRIDFVFFATSKSDMKGAESYPVYGFNIKISRSVARLSALTFGLEWTSDHADKAEIERLNILVNDRFADHRYGAFLVGHDLLLGKFIFSTELGVYVYSPYERLDEVYQRYGLTVHVSKTIFAGINIKAHRHVADFLDIRAGVSF